MAELFQVENLLPEDKMRELVGMMCRVDAESSRPPISDSSQPQIDGYVHTTQQKIIVDGEGNTVDTEVLFHILAPKPQSDGYLTESNKETLLPKLKKFNGVESGEVTIMEDPTNLLGNTPFEYKYTLKEDGTTAGPESVGEIPLPPGSLLVNAGEWTRRRKVLIVKALRCITNEYSYAVPKGSEGNYSLLDVAIIWPEVTFPAVRMVKNIYDGNKEEAWLDVKMYASRYDKEHSFVTKSWLLKQDPISILIGKSLVGKSYAWMGNDVFKEKEEDRFIIEITNLSQEAQDKLEEAASAARDEYKYSQVQAGDELLKLWDGSTVDKDGHLTEPSGAMFKGKLDQFKGLKNIFKDISQQCGDLASRFAQAPTSSVVTTPSGPGTAINVPMTVINTLKDVKLRVSTSISNAEGAMSSLDLVNYAKMIPGVGDFIGQISGIISQVKSVLSIIPD